MKSYFSALIALHFLLTALTYLGCNRPICISPRKPDHQLDASKIVEGTYVITMLAKHGSKNGESAQGYLWLKRASIDDRSPRTGEKAARTRGLMIGYTRHLFYGAMELDFRKIGATVCYNNPSPMCSEDKDPKEPAPTSCDPIYPGVLISADQKEIELHISSFLNQRNDQTILGGTGVCVYIHRIDDAGFYGVWGRAANWGDGEGFFCARRIKKADLPNPCDQMSVSK